MNEAQRASRVVRLLDRVEALGNRLPDPAVLFLALLIAVWVLSAALAQFSYSHVDPRTGAPLEIQNLATASQLAHFLSQMVPTFVGFHPLGVVLIAMLGIGVADHTGFIRTGLKALMNLTSKAVVTPMLLLIAIISHTAVDAGYVLVIPLGAVIFQAAGRHPLAGIAAAFAGVSGGFSANFVPSALDPMLQGITQAGAQIIDPGIALNPLNNWFFTSASTLLIVGLGWYLTDRVIEPRLSGTALDGDLAEAPELTPLTADERRGLIAALAAMGLALIGLFVSALPEGSAWRAADGQLTVGAAPLMRSIVPLIFLIFLIPGIVFGYVAKTIAGHRDLITGMTQAMSGLAYYLVMAFFASLFIAEFGALQPRRADRAGGRGAAQGGGAARLRHGGGGHPDHWGGQPVRRLRIGQVGAAGADPGAHADAAWPVSGPHPSGLPGGRLLHQHHHAAHALLPAGGGVLPALRQERGHRHRALHDAALRHRLSGGLDRLPAGLLGSWPAVGATGQLWVLGQRLVDVPVTEAH